MRTIAIISQKGGAGKTTLALHLAASAAHANTPVCIIDTDPQGTAAAWGDWRGDYAPEVMISPPLRLAATITKSARRGFALAVVDTPPNAETAVREAVRLADLILMPARPRAFDLHALQATADFVKSSRKPAFVFFNAVPPRTINIVEEAARFVTGLGLSVCPVSFGDRVAFHKHAAAGAAAIESEPRGKAAAEATALWNWVVQQAGLG